MICERFKSKMNRKDGSETEDVVYCDACFVKTNVIG